MKKLIIVESPTKAKTIKEILKGKYEVIASKGHIKDLPKSRLGVDIENSFEPDFIVIKGKGEIIKEIKEAAEKAEEIYIGCDPDREGEAIAYHIFSLINEKSKKNIKRILIYEITREGLFSALNTPSEIDTNKVNAHKARRVLDRLVGYLVSPLLWKIFGQKNLSAGRVQTVALRILCEREKEIEEFIPQEYWLIFADFGLLRALLTKIADQKIEIKSEEAAEKLIAEIKRIENFKVREVSKKIKTDEPPPPFITSTLQQEASRILGFSAKKTMALAQKLFEGVQLKSERVGLITYPRTDSFRINDTFINKIREYIKNNYGEEYLAKKIRKFKEKRFTQGAHEAIRPTNLDKTPETVKEYLTEDEFRLYQLIYHRTISSQMAAAIYEQIKITISGEGEKNYLFEAEGRKRIFEGYEKGYYEKKKEKIIPELKAGEKLSLKEVIKEKHFTEPPPRYTEATLIKKLEKYGIGRPSTYAVIISTLLERHYVKKEKKTLVPTELGRLVNEILIPHFSKTFNIDFTRLLEENLDQIEEGQEEWQKVVKRFYDPFTLDLNSFENKIENFKNNILKEIDENCPQCGARLKIRYSRFGKFIACSNYPHCFYVKKENNYLKENCPICGRPLVARKSRFGPFIACSGYPECKYKRRQ
uniref:DNA topoisomerase 1 n=1 Tax=candidate division WOR-3 bacterium TaxID=2052148 RepID=A0A7V5Y0I7_UNCW3